ncbi:hypothetical protein [Novosphingobium taihuense]|uniref:Lipoprotein n=1 Tax=Novosphingobium taihuense TaxID=260085 RepID=A0A7W7AEE1_9SPHN|nr:hypothetical protein [Novosphingobium taihuense]MBB4614607.1 hypothetical protein [Novosphingobium taihuense]TWH86151.1 hypothetical protein IQ25_01599 [Novosphingobium taihuense]
MRLLAVSLPIASILLSGCVAKSAFDLATMPVRAGARAVNTTADVYDRVTVSDSERDQKRGREMRQREERYGKLSREYDKARRDCSRGDDDACDDARSIYAEMDAMRAGVPYEARN